MSQRVMLGLSGGVDSAVAALLLTRHGYTVEALFMKNWEEDDDADYCAAAADLEDARVICELLGLNLHTVNFSSEYWDRVFQYFLNEYRAGRTPNPDVLCNREIKFRAFLDHALTLGAERIATGHYARIDRSDQGFRLLRGIDPHKDQSYFLHALNQNALAHTLFPLGEQLKSSVREIAAGAGLPNHAKKDSTGICFIGERRFRDFLGRYLPARPGRIRTVAGEVIGEHQGLMFHTIGQRQGLGIGGRRESSGEPWFVIDKDPRRNDLIVAQGVDHPLLYHSALLARQCTWIAGVTPPLPLRCQARIRYRQASQACTLETGLAGSHRIRFDTPQRAITPGQSIVFYDGEVCLGGGIIEHVVE